MKDKKLYRLTIVFVIISMVGFLGCLIAALILRELRHEYLGWYIAAGIFVVIIFVSLYFLIKFVKTKDYKTLVKNTRATSLNRAKLKHRIQNYVLKCEAKDLGVGLEGLLKDYNSENLSNGRIFYNINKSIFNTKKISIDIFFVLNTDIVNTFNHDLEEENINNYCSQIQNFLCSKGISQDFINCVIIFQHTFLNEQEKDFYYTFIGLWDADMDGEKFVKHWQFAYCGVDGQTNQIFFFKPLSTNNGMEANLNYLIIKELA